MSLRGTVARTLRRTGQQWTLLRKVQAPNAQPWKSGAETLTFDTVQARERHFKPMEIRGGILEGDVLIVVDAATCATTPQIGDRLAPGVFASEDTDSPQWRHVIAVHNARESGVDRVYRIQARL